MSAREAIHESDIGRARSWYPVLLIALFAAAWGFVEITIGARVQGQYDLLQIVWSRYAVHLLIVILIWGRSDPLGLWRTRRPVFHLSRSLMMLVMPWSFAAALLSGVPVSQTWLLFWVSPLLVIALGKWFGGESPAVWAWGLAAVAWVGVALMVGHSLPAHVVDMSLPLVMAASFAVYVLMTRSLRHEPLHVNLAYTATGVFAVLSLRMPFVWVTPSPHDALLFCGIGAFGLVALLALDRAVAAAPIWIVAPGMAFQPAVEAALAMTGSGRLPASRVLAGMLLVCTCLLLTAMLAGRRQPVIT